jgi:hypothetical protein
MKALVVYESHWGNTAAVAQAIAAGIGPDAAAVTTDQAPPADVAAADLVVVGAPVLAFSLPSDRMLGSLAAGVPDAPSPPDLGHPSMRSWLDGLAPGHGYAATFETAVRWSPGGAAGTIDKSLTAAGYERIAKGRRFVVSGRFGPLRDGELDAAKRWGAELSQATLAAPRKPEVPA